MTDTIIRADSQFLAAVEAERPTLIRFARLQLGAVSHVEDVVQETLLAAIEGSERFNKQSSLRTWLIGILRHKIVDALRRSHPRAVSVVETATPEDQWFDESGHWREETGPAYIEWRDPATLAEQQQLLGVLEKCLERLPAAWARVFMLRELQGMDSREICSTLAISESNLNVQLYRARTHLRACLELHWFNCDAARPT